MPMKTAAYLQFKVRILACIGRLLGHTCIHTHGRDG